MQVDLSEPAERAAATAAELHRSSASASDVLLRRQHVSGRDGWSQSAMRARPGARRRHGDSAARSRDCACYVGPGRRPHPLTSTTIDASAAEASGVARVDGRRAYETRVAAGRDASSDSGRCARAVAAVAARGARQRPRREASSRRARCGSAHGVTRTSASADADDDTPDDEMRTQAVFALSQRPKSESVPELDRARALGQVSVGRRAGDLLARADGRPARRRRLRGAARATLAAGTRRTARASTP